MELNFKTEATDDLAVAWVLFIGGFVAGAGVLAFILMLTGVFGPENANVP